ncbi:MAG: PspC domain-containing protein [bacterium]|nr:PspC domain-containing protein [bacterium]
MKKTISINLGGTLFYAEDDAFARLDSYLREVERYFSAKGDDSAEILRDIETSLAEHFNAAGAGELKRAVTLPEVEDALKNMGTINDFSDEEKVAGKTFTKTESDGPRRFYRDGDSAVIGGVCAGLGHYFGIDPVWIRLLFALSLFLWGFGVIIYFLLWIAAPEAKTAAEKLVMQGAAVNLSSLTAQMKENINSEKIKDTSNAAADSFTRFFKRLFALIGRVFQGFGPLIRIFFGLLFGLVALTGFCAITLVGLIATLNGPQYLEPGFITAIGWSYPWLVSALTLVAAIPFLVVLFASISLLINRKLISGLVWLLMLLLWFAGILSLGTLGSDAYTRVHPYLSESRLENITINEEVKSISVDAPYYLTVIVGNEVKLRAEGHPADLSRIETSVTNGVLQIEAQRLDTRICITCGRSINLVLEMPTSTLQNITMNGGSVLNMKNWQSDKLALAFYGYSGGNLSVDVTTLQLQTTDFADVDFLEGEIDELAASFQGWSRINTRPTKISRAAITLGGSARGTVEISELLKLQVLPNSSSARLFYNPDVKLIEADISAQNNLRLIGQERDNTDMWVVEDSVEENLIRLERLEDEYQDYENDVYRYQVR